MTNTSTSTTKGSTGSGDDKRILVGVDDSPEARAAISYAGQVAESQPVTEIVLAHAYEDWPAGTQDRTIDRLHAEAVDRAQSLVDGLADELRTMTSTPVRTVISSEKPTNLLRVMCADAQMVIVGQDTAGLLDRLTFGSIAAHLAASAPCPVVVVPAPWHRHQFGDHPVVVALSGDDLSAEPLAQAIEQAQYSGTAVLALHAIPYFDSVEEAEERKERLAEIVDAAVESHPGVEVRAMVVRGSPEEHLVKQSVNACATVVGRTHHGGPTAWTRSVAHALIKRTHCPLIIVPLA